MIRNTLIDGNEEYFKKTKKQASKMVLMRKKRVINEQESRLLKSAQT